MPEGRGYHTPSLPAKKMEMGLKYYWFIALLFRVLEQGLHFRKNIVSVSAALEFGGHPEYEMNSKK